MGSNQDYEHLQHFDCIMQSVNSNYKFLQITAITLKNNLKSTFTGSKYQCLSYRSNSIYCTFGQTNFIIMQQKKFVFHQPKNPKQKRQTQSSADLHYYGPPPSPTPFIHQSIGRLANKRPIGLIKRRRDLTFEQLLRQESDAYMQMRAGQTPLLRRLSKLRYLQSWKSKKPVYNVCEESVVSKLHEKLLKCRQHRMQMGHRKCSTMISY